MPAGVTFTAGSNGTATIAGNPTASGTFTVTLTAANGISPNATQSLVITVAPASVPRFTSAANATATHAKAFSFTVSASGSPAPAITESGALPTGVTFTPGNGTASLSGTPTKTGTYRLTFTAKNVAGTANQTFTLTVN